ncbi:interleukin-17C-like isoform X1 [Hypanus sabinus]|nr:interleukin-17C-like isoform X1 [Hypanus sabinus]
MQRGERLGNQGAMWAVQLLMIVSMWVSLGQTGRPRREGRNQCFAAEELDVPGKVLQKLLRRANAGHLLSVNLVEQLERQQVRQGHCPKMGHQSIHNPKIRHRSISPWEYRIDYDENRYPSKLAFARCLCDGCIDAESGEETLALNSVPLKQSMLVLQRQACAGRDDRYSLELKYIQVPVGCTCVLPRSH